MIRAVRLVVHENATPKDAYDYYLSLKSEGRG
jgi:hypothetical protein